MLCPFCAQENGDQLAVCRACHRDTIIPLSLKTERQELFLKLEVLRSELRTAHAKLGTSRRWFGLLGNAREN
jgi:hypothetical protein